MIRLLVHSKDPRVCGVLGPALLPEFEVTLEENEDRVADLAFSAQTDVLILDFDSDYSDLNKRLDFFDRIEPSGIPTVVMSDDKTRSAALRLMHRPACDYFRKPLSLLELRVILRRAYERAKLKWEVSKGKGGESQHPQPACGQLVGESLLSQGVYALIRRVAPLDASVLVTGESGTGKELAARAIHALSDRAAAPFVAVSCGAIPETLWEAELFGHEKGAYTGTTGSREGCFERAGAGTIFLDEIGELSLNSQVKLLRVLQQREFCRLGSRRMIPMRARVIFASHRNLSRMVKEGKFRSDLYFRVNVMQIKMPPLRQRPEEIPLLAHHFLVKYSAEYSKRVTRIHPGAMARLKRYDWPGNVRELENAIARGIIVAEGESILARDLPDTIRDIDTVVSIQHYPSTLRSFEGTCCPIES